MLVVYGAIVISAMGSMSVEGSGIRGGMVPGVAERSGGGRGVDGGDGGDGGERDSGARTYTHTYCTYDRDGSRVKRERGT